MVAGDSLYKGKFNDEKNGLKLKHDAPGGRSDPGGGEGVTARGRDSTHFCLFPAAFLRGRPTTPPPPRSVPPFFCAARWPHIFFPVGLIFFFGHGGFDRTS